MVKNVKTVTMAPHKSKLSKMDEHSQQSHIRGREWAFILFNIETNVFCLVVDVERHNIKHAAEMKKENAVDEDEALTKIRKRQSVLMGREI